MGKIIRCTDCLYDIDLDKDQFCLVTPHGQRYSHKGYIPLCPDCRAEQGYDIRVNYYIVKPHSGGMQSKIAKEFKQPSLPRLEYKPFTEQIALENLGLEPKQDEEIVICMSNKIVEEESVPFAAS